MLAEERPDERIALLAAALEETRRDAVLACARARDVAAVEALRRLSGDDPSIEVRYLARKALHLILEAHPEAAPAHPGPKPLPADPSADELRAHLAAPDPVERAWALREIAARELAALLPDVLARVGQEPEAAVRAQLVGTLATIGGGPHRKEVAAFIRDPDARVRANAVEALELLRDPTAYALIIKALQDPDHRVKLNAISALHRVGKLNILVCCEKMLRNKDYWLRDAAAYCLASARLPEAVPVLVKALDDAYAPVRIKAKQGLAAMASAGDAAARDALEQAGGIKDHEKAADFLDAFTSTPPPPTAPDPEEKADEGHIPLILDRLREEADPSAIAKHLDVLGELGNPVVASIVREFENHESPSVRKAAEQSLRRLGQEAPFVPPSSPVRRTGTRPAAPPPAPPSFWSQYGLLVLPVVIVAVVSGLVVVSMARRPAPPAKTSGRASPPATGMLERIAGAADVASYVGKVVTWSGAVTEVSPDRDRLMVKSGAHYFSGRSETPLPETVKPGAAVKVTGVIVDRRQGVVMVLVRGVKL